MEKMKRINQIRRKLSNDYKTVDIETGKKGPMKTLLVRVMTPSLKERLKNKRKKPELLPQTITDASFENLQRLLADYTKMKEAIFTFYWNEFKRNPIELMLKVTKPLPSKIDRSNLIPEMTGDEKRISSGFQCSKCQQPLFVFRPKQADSKGKIKSFYFGKCTDNKHRLVLLKPLKPESEDESTTYSLGKFGQRALDFYKIHIKEKSNHPVKPLGQFGNDSYNSGAVGKALSDACMGAIASFLTKYQDTIIAHQKDVRKNEERLKNLKAISEKKGLVFPNIILPPQPRTKEDVESYNDIVSEIRIWTNLNFWQKEKLNKDEAQPPKKLKGFPSFPVVERDEKKIDWWQKINEVKKLINEKKKVGKDFWTNLSEEKRKEVLENYLPTEKDLQKQSKPPRRQIGDLLLHLEKKHDKNWKKIFDETLERVGKKINHLTKHVRQQEKMGKIDNQSKAALTDWLRAKASFLLEGLKESDETEFRRCELLLQKSYGELRGKPFAKEGENRVVDIGGFSISNDGRYIQYRSVLSWRYREGGHRDFYLLLNYGKERRIRFPEKNGKKTKDAWHGLLYGGGTPKIVTLNFDENDKQLIILPLAFGKRQGREFIWNDLLSLETGVLKLANGRVIEKMLYNKKTGKDESTFFAALAFERRNVIDPSKIKPECLLGVDRGENVPAVVALTDPEGCPLQKFKDKDNRPTHVLRLGEDYKKKQRGIQAAKEVEQRNIGGYSRRLASKAKNLADNMVRNVARDLFYHAIMNDAKIVFEDLARGFGRSGKKTFMSERQYTKIEDWLIAKLNYEGLWKRTGQLKVNQTHGYLAKSIAQYTSKTCSGCGFVITNDDYEKMFVSLENTSHGWEMTFNKKKFKVDGEITYYSRYQKKTITKDLAAELDRWFEESARRNPRSWTKERRNKMLFFLKKRFNHRPAQEKFICLDCGYQTHADEQAALNIARSWLFLKSKEYKKYQEDKKTNAKDKRRFVDAWQSFYKRKLEEVWKPHP